MNIPAQAVGIAAMCFSIISFQMSTEKRIIVVQTITAALFMLHFAMLGAFTGAVMNATSIVRNIVFYNIDKCFFSGNIWVFVFVCINIAAGICSWQNAVSLLSIAGMVFNTISMSLKNPQRLRQVMLISSPFALIYSFLNGSIGGAVNEILSEISMVAALLRYKRFRG